MSVCKEHCIELCSGTNTMQMAPVYSSGNDACWVMCDAACLHHGAWCRILLLLSLSCDGMKAFRMLSIVSNSHKHTLHFISRSVPHIDNCGIEPHSTFQIDTASMPSDGAEIERKAIDWGTNTTKAEP